MSGDRHFYQLSSTVPSGYQAYGIACYVYASGGPGRVPLNRFYNSGSDDHFYSVNPTVPAGYVLEGNVGWVSAQHTNTPISAPWIRFFNPSTGGHFYQTLPKTPVGYLAEGIEGEVFPVETIHGNRLPLYRYYNPSSSKHFYTTLTATPPQGYVSEGIAGYVSRVPGPGLVQLHRFLQKNNGGHYYSLDPKTPDAYAPEAEQMWVWQHTDPASGPDARFNQFYNSKLDDHFYTTDNLTPAGYTPAPAMGFLKLHPETSGLVPLFQFYKPFHKDEPSALNKALHVAEAVGVGALLGGAPGAILGGIEYKDVDNAVSTVGKYTLGGGGSLIGLAAAGASLILMGEYMAVVVYVATTTVANFVIKQRPLRTEERNFLMGIFMYSLPYDDILITNVSGVSGRAFTLPNPGGKPVVNLGSGAYDNPMTYTSAAYPVPGQMLVHEMTHVWQIHKSSFKPGYVCEGIKEQYASSVLGQDVYTITDADLSKRWGSLSNEQQATLVDQWFAKGCHMNNEPRYRFARLVAGMQPSSAVP